MDKRQRKIVRGQLAHINRETQISDVRIRELDPKKVWSCLAHLRTIDQADGSNQAKSAA